MPRRRSAAPALAAAVVAVLLTAATTLSGCAGASMTFVDPTTGLRSGKLLHDRRCAECHALYAPGSYTPAQWRGIVADMAERAHLSDEDAALIYDYLAAR